MADKERIMLLEGQLAELSDRMAEYERERMLRDVAEEDVIQAKAYELALKMARKTAERKRLEKPIWTAFISWATSEIGKHPPGSAMYGALNYLLTHRKSLMAYLNFPLMPIDNNECERGFKPLVKGRKTSYFFQNLHSAWRGSMMYSFFGSCAMNDINPQKWLTYVLEHILTTPEDKLIYLLPQHFSNV